MGKVVENGLQNEQKGPLTQLENSLHLMNKFTTSAFNSLTTAR